MRMSVSAVLCASLATAAPPVAADSVPVAVLVVDPGSTQAQQTPFRTAPDRPYTITVSGVFTWNGIDGFGLADCGHRDDSRPGPWASWIWLLLDGAPARCSAMPVSETHTYTWVEMGTGDPFRFQAPSTSDPTQNKGALVVTVVRGRVGEGTTAGGAVTTPPACRASGQNCRLHESM